MFLKKHYSDVLEETLGDKCSVKNKQLYVERKGKRITVQVDTLEDVNQRWAGMRVGTINRVVG